MQITTTQNNGKITASAEVNGKRRRVQTPINEELSWKLNNIAGAFALLNKYDAGLNVKYDGTGIVSGNVADYWTVVN